MEGHHPVAHLGAEAREGRPKLQRSGIAATLAMDDRSLKAQLKQANALGFSHAVVIGERELWVGSVTLRDMAKGEQAQLSVDEVIRKLKR